MRKRMREAMFATTALAGLLFAGAAQAADLPRKAPVLKAPVAAPFTWTGFYVGGHVGYGWGDKDISLVDPDIVGQKFGGPGVWDCGGPIEFCFDFTNLTNPIVKHQLSGLLGGVQAGFNVQHGSWVFGVEGQFSWTDMDDESKVNLGEFRFKFFNYGFTAPIDLLAKTEVNWVATIAGRIGYTWDRFLIYAKGGVAFADQDYTWLVTKTKGDDVYEFATAKFSETRTGWMVGAGLEWVLTGSWSAKVEYNYMDFGSDTLNFVADVKGHPKDVTVDIDEKMHVVKFGINYRFGGPGAVTAKY